MTEPTMDEVMAQAAKVARLLWIYSPEERERRFAQALEDTIATLGGNPIAEELSRAVLAMQLERLDRDVGHG